MAIIIGHSPLSRHTHHPLASQAREKKTPSGKETTLGELRTAYDKRASIRLTHKVIQSDTCFFCPKSQAFQG